MATPNSYASRFAATVPRTVGFDGEGERLALGPAHGSYQGGNSWGVVSSSSKTAVLQAAVVCLVLQLLMPQAQHTAR